MWDSKSQNEKMYSQNRFFKQPLSAVSNLRSVSSLCWFYLCSNQSLTQTDFYSPAVIAGLQTRGFLTCLLIQRHTHTNLCCMCWNSLFTVILETMNERNISYISYFRTQFNINNVKQLKGPTWTFDSPSLFLRG